MNRKALVRLAAALALAAAVPLAAQNALEILTLRYRTAEQVLPALRPLLPGSEPMNLGLLGFLALSCTEGHADPGTLRVASPEAGLQAVETAHFVIRWREGDAAAADVAQAQVLRIS